MVVLVIIGVLTLLALPRFSGVINRAKMTEARTMLAHVHTLQRAYFYEHDRYAVTLVDLGFEQSTLISDGGTARYVISIEKGDETSYTALATSVVDFNKNGVFNVWEVDETGQVRVRTPD